VSTGARGMKLSVGVVVLGAFQSVSAFTAGGSKAFQSRPARVSAPIMAGGWGITDISPDGKLMQRVEGQTRRTWSFNDMSKDRVQVAMTSEGRPMTADIQLWIGPDWTPFTLKAYSEDGKVRPIQTIIGTRNKAAMIEVRNIGDYQFPFKAASDYAKGDMAALPKAMPDANPGQRCDGAGAVRSFPLGPAAQRAVVVLKTEGKQLNARIELLNAPNNPKQVFEVFTNNGELNSLCVCFEMPADESNTIRVINQATVEFPCYIHLAEE